MELVSNKDLNEICIKVLDNIWAIKPDYHYFFDTLYRTGARAREPLIQFRWTPINETTIRLEPLKNNNFRIFNTVNLNPSFVDMVYNSNFRLDPGNYSMLVNYFLRAMPVNLFLDNERTLFHIFRYNRVRQLSESGYSINEIKNEFGWSSPLMVEKYLYRPISYALTSPGLP
jgi:hypothetical protein